MIYSAGQDCPTKEREKGEKHSEVLCWRNKIQKGRQPARFGRVSPRYKELSSTHRGGRGQTFSGGYGAPCQCAGKHTGGPLLGGIAEYP